MDNSENPTIRKSQKVDIKTSESNQDTIKGKFHHHQPHHHDSDTDALNRRLAEIRRRKEALENAPIRVVTKASTPSPPSFDPGDILKQEHRFIRSDKDDEEAKDSWEKEMAKQYHEKLFKEFALADLSKAKEGKVGLRWRLEKEVKIGKGTEICGNKACSARDGLKSFELPFKYIEAGENKIALVKLRVCPECSIILQSKKKHKEVDEMDEIEKKLEKKRKRTEDSIENEELLDDTSTLKRKKNH